MSTSRKFLGIVVSPANVQTEGLSAVMDTLEALETDAIAIDPWLLQPAPPGNGSRIPDLHIDGHRRLFARPLWGRRTLHVESFLAFEPDSNRYVDTPYRPAWKPVPAGLDPELPEKMISEAHARGMAVHMGIGPFTPPSPRDADRPRLVTGDRIPSPRIADNVCLNTPAGRAYALAFIEDVLSNYPGLDGLVVDWAEFGAYRLEDHFTCFCTHCREKAGALGFDWDRITRDVSALWTRLHALSEADLARSRRVAGSPSALLELLAAYPGWLDFLRFKAGSVLDFYTTLRAHLDRVGCSQVALTARGWISPWNRSSGMDYARLAEVPAIAAPKIFTFDHAVLPRWLGEKLLAWNPGLGEAEILAAVLDWLNLPDDRSDRSLADYQIPAPDEPHPARIESYAGRIDEVVDQVDGRAACYPIAHPYLPVDQWREMLRMLRASRADGIWINFYSFLSDAHIGVLREIWRAEKVVRI